MKILAIETSCDETAVAILEGSETVAGSHFTILGNALLSQIDIHKEYGGVFPALAKRAHAQNLVPLLASALEEAELLHESRQPLADEKVAALTTLLEREPEMLQALLAFLAERETPDIDAIAVTHGPGLEPALWVGVNLARALASVWNKPLVGVNHMEGHMLSALARADGKNLSLENIELPVLGLLISGGHTEIVSMPQMLSYKLLGRTLDDAAGEAFDKVARMLELPYPGGPEISKLAEARRAGAKENSITLPRPMLTANSCDFSFSGLKTAVLYQLKAIENITDEQKSQMAEEFENAVADVLYAKTARALEESNAVTLVLGGGVSGNVHIRRVFEERLRTDFPHVILRIPVPSLTTDNAVMIALSGYYRALREEFSAPETLRADGNLSLA